MADPMQTLRQTEFSRLDATGQIYLDYTGGGLYAESQIRAHADTLLSGVFGNPHSTNPTSLASTHNVEAARERIRRFFNASADEYEVVFTLNASGALKLVGESFPFSEGSTFVLTADNHNSVNGIREFARHKGADVRYLPLTRELRAENVEKLLSEIAFSQPSLFGFPAQSNFSGVKHPLEWVKMAKDLGFYTLLDAAAFVPSSRLDLSIVKPDFVSVSFYKMFGFPTGVGALIVRRDAMHILERPWFGGGTVKFVSAQNERHLLAASGEAFEDGTLNYLSIAGVPVGLDFVESVGIDAINAHVTRLTGYLLEQLLALKHSNGKPLLHIYGPTENVKRGGTVSFNVMDPNGSEIYHKRVEDAAAQANISIRAGCFCNPGAAEFAFQYAAVRSYQCFDTISPEEFTLQQFSTCMNYAPVGAIRVSVGIASNEADIDALIAVLRAFIDAERDLTVRHTVPTYVGQ